MNQDLVERLMFELKASKQEREERRRKHELVNNEVIVKETVTGSSSNVRRSQQLKDTVEYNDRMKHESENERMIGMIREIQEIKEENTKITNELEERKKEILEIKKRVEKLEKIIEKKNEIEEKRNVKIEQMVSYIDRMRKEGEKVEEKAKKFEKGVAQNIEEQLDKRMYELKKERDKEEEKIKIETECHKKEIEELKWKNEMQERRGKRNNIIIRGMEKGPRSKEGTEKWLSEKLETDVKVKDMWTIKSTLKNEVLIGIELASWEVKKEVMKGKSKLKVKERDVFIDNDLTRQERKVRRIINDKKAEVKRNSQNTIVKVGYYWIEIDKIRFVYDERKNEPGLIRLQDSPKNKFF